MVQLKASGSCPRCGGAFREHRWLGDGGIEVEGTTEEGQLSLCAHCATLLVFKSDLTLRELTEEESARLRRHDPEYWEFLGRARLAVLAVQFERSMKA